MSKWWQKYCFQTVAFGYIYLFLIEMLLPNMTHWYRIRSVLFYLSCHHHSIQPWSMAHHHNDWCFNTSADSSISGVVDEKQNINEQIKRASDGIILLLYKKKKKNGRMIRGNLRNELIYGFGVAVMITDCWQCLFFLSLFTCDNIIRFYTGSACAFTLSLARHQLRI